MIPSITDQNLEQLRYLLREHGAPIRILQDDVSHLLAMRDGTDEQLRDAFLIILTKLEIFVGMDIPMPLLKREPGDVTSQPKPTGAKRTYGHVVPSKSEQVRRDSGGGHPMFGSPKMWDEDDGIPGEWHD